MQSRNGFIQNPLHPDDERGIVLLRRLDGGMPEQELNRAEISAIPKKVDAERIAEAVRVAVLHVSQLQHLGYQVGHAGEGDNSLVGHRPKEVGGFRRESPKGIKDDRGQLTIEGHASFHDADEHFAGPEVNGATPEIEGVRNSESAVQHNEDEGGSALTQAVCSFLIERILDCAARFKNAPNFLRREGHSGNYLHAGSAQHPFLGEVLSHPFAVEAVSKEGFEDRHFDDGAGGCDLPPFGAEGSEHFEGDAGHQDGQEVTKRDKLVCITDPRGLRNVASLAVGEERLNRPGNTRGLWQLGGAPNFQTTQPILGMGPGSGFEGLALALAELVYAVSPDGAVALDVADAHFFETATGFMAAIKALHDFEHTTNSGTLNGTSPGAACK